MNRGFYVPCAPYAYPDSNNDNDKKNNGSSRGGNSKDGKGFFRLSKFLSRNRVIIRPGSKEEPEEEISIGSSNTAKTGSSSVSNESRRTDYSNREAAPPSRMPSIGSYFRRLMRFKSSQRNNGGKTTTGEQIIVVVPSVEAFPVINENAGIASDIDQQRSQHRYTEDYDNKNLDERVAAVAEKLSEFSKTSTPVITAVDDDDADGPPLFRSSTTTQEDVVTVNSVTTIPLISSTVTTVTNPLVEEPRISGNDTSRMIVADDDNFDVVDAANLSGVEVHVLQSDRRTPDAPESRSDRFIETQESEESRIKTNVSQSIVDDSHREVERNGSTIGTVGSESSSVISEVADRNEQQQQQQLSSESRDDNDNDDDEDDDDAADQYYNAVLRALLRKQFRHHDDEPPIY